MATLMQTRVLDRVVELCAKVRAQPGCGDFPIPEVYFFARRAAAGLAHLGKNRIGINGVLLEENPESMLRETVAHELAHLVVYWRWCSAPGMYARRPAPHGREWKAVMRGLFGVEPERTHRYDVSRVGVRRQRQWAYVCPCRTHKVTTVRHRKMLDGAARYRCASCKGQLSFLGEVL